MTRRSIASATPLVLLRAAPAGAIGVAVLVALLAAALVALPAWFNRAAARGLPGDLTAAGPGRVGLEWGQGGLATSDANPVEMVEATGTELVTALPPALAGIAAPVTILLDTPEYLALDAPVPITRLALRIQPDAAGMTRITEGRAPAGTVGEHQVGSLEGPDGQPLIGRSLEVALSRETATELGLAVGDRLALMPGQNRYGIGISVLVAGIFEVVDPGDPRWFDDRTLASPVEVRVSSEVTMYHAVALVDPGVGPELALLGSGTPLLQYRWRIPLDASTAAAWDAEAMMAALTRLQARYPFHGSAATDAPGLTTGLADILARDAARRQAAGSAFTLAAAGPLAAGMGLLALVAGALADRRRPVLRLLRARGARRRHLLAADLVAGLFVIVPGATAGALAGALAGGMAAGGAAATGAEITRAGGIAAALGLGTGALLAVGSLRGPVTARLYRPVQALVSVSRARMATALLVLIAGLAVAALRTAANGQGGLAVAVPLLVALAGGVVLARAVGTLAGWLARLAARARRLGPVHAMRGLARGSGQGLLLSILVMTVAAGVFTSLVDASLTHAQAEAAAAETGADYQVAARGPAGLPTDLDTKVLAALGPIAIVETGAATLSSQTLAATFTTFATLDPEAYARVMGAAGAKPDARLAAGLADASRVDGVGLVLRAEFAGRFGLGTGSVITFAAGGRSAPATVVAVLDAMPGIDPEVSAVIPAPQLITPAGAVGNPGAGGSPGGVSVPVAVLLAAPADDAAVAAAVAPYLSLLEIRSRSAIVDRLRAAPVASAVRDGFTLAGWLAAALTGLVTGASLLAAMGTRGRDVAILRALGLTAAAARRLVLAELALVVVAGMTTGVALGIATAWLTMGDLGLERLAGVDGTVAVTLEAQPVLAALVLEAAGALLAILLAWPMVRRRAHSGRTLTEEPGR